MTEAGGDSATRVSLASVPERSPMALEATIDGQPEALILYRDGDAVRAWTGRLGVSCRARTAA